jgi:tyrosyl-tRNA synthetase
MAEARRLIEQGGVRINEEKVTRTDADIDVTVEEVLIQVGKRRFVRVRGE